MSIQVFGLDARGRVEGTLPTSILSIIGLSARGTEAMRYNSGNGFAARAPMEQSSGLAEKNCVPCRGGVPPLKGRELAELEKQVEGWTVVEEHHLRKTFKFPDFRRALEFVNRVGELAEQQGHHPDIFLAWGKVGITLWTHAVDGLTESDFILAAKIDRL